MRRLAFEFLPQQEYFGTAAMMVSEFIATIQRIETAESSGHLDQPWHAIHVQLSKILM